MDVKPEEFKIDPDNGCIIGSDDCHYDTKIATLHFAKLHLCGCGQPVDAYNFCRQLLIAIDERSKYNLPLSHKVHELILDNLDAAVHVLTHVFNHYGLLEHGSSVYGSWLSEAGRQIVDFPEATEKDFER